MKKLFLFTFLVVMTLYLKNWLICSNFQNQYHFSSYNLHLQLEDAIHNDKSLDFVLIRLYHNKIIFFLIDIFSPYLRFFDIQFLINLLSPAGAFGLMYILWYFAKIKKINIYSKFLLGISLILPLGEMTLNFFLPFPYKIIFFSLPYQLLAYFGFSRYFFVLPNTRKFVFAVVFLWVSLAWWFIFPFGAKEFCH